MRNPNDVLPMPATALRARRRRSRFPLLLVAAALASRAPAAHAETFNVACNASALASVIATVNSNGEEDFVWLTSPCVYALATTWVVEPDAGNPVWVYGRGARISGQDARTPLVVNAGATLHLSEVTVRDGSTTGNGGGIRNAGTLTVDESVITESASQAYGGGIYNTGTARLTRSTVSANTASVQGGGVDNAAGKLTLVDSTVSGNSGSYGGGLRNRGSATLFNSTLFGNGAFIGGGILNDPAGRVALANVTISENAISGSNGGGGIRNEGDLRIDNSIIANHPSGQADCYNSGSLIPLTSNLIEDGSCALVGSFTGDPMLGAPSGRPQSIPLAKGSPAIDAGANPVCAGADQNGARRPYDGNEDGYSICDLGAIEWRPARACGLLGIDALLVLLPLARLVARARRAQASRAEGGAGGSSRPRS
ncbi:MAG: hypothetical protein DCC71_02855 [Proteobacteria bacterium]|nr:MAG: hypothetical protein DCC71_02855 [Pseudomonadota bacterium]